MFWEWDPQGFGPERDLLPDEYGAQVSRTLDLLEAGADTEELVVDLVGWLGRNDPPEGPARDPKDIAAAAERIADWWQEWLGRPGSAPVPPLWGSVPTATWLVVWLTALLLAFARGVSASGLSLEAVDVAASVAALAFALLPAAAILGAPRIGSQNPALLNGAVLLVLSQVIPGLMRRPLTDMFMNEGIDQATYQVAQSAVSALGLALVLAATFLLTSGMRRTGARPGRWLLAAAIIAIALELSMYAAAVMGNGQPFVDWVGTNLPAVSFELVVGAVALFASVALFLFALAGARAGSLPRGAWALAAAGFGARVLAPIAAGFGLVIGQATGAAGASFGGYLLGLIARMALPAAFLLGLGGGTTPPWVEAVSAWWTRSRHAVVVQ